MRVKAGVWLWNEGVEEVHRCADAGVDEVYIKSGDFAHGFLGFVVKAGAALSRGLAVYAWHYVYGAFGEGPAAVSAIHSLPIKGLVLDAEMEYRDAADLTNQARLLLDELEAGLPGIPVAVSSFAQPSRHRNFPAEPFGSDPRVSLYMPQIFPKYWGLTVAQALTLTQQEYERAGIPGEKLWPCFELFSLDDNHSTSYADITDALTHAEAGGYEHVSFFRAGVISDEALRAITAYRESWEPVPPPVPDPTPVVPPHEHPLPEHAHPEYQSLTGAAALMRRAFQRAIDSIDEPF